MSSPLLSVVIPTYNRAALIESTLQSVLKQSVQHLEVIVVDDGSTDGTAEVVDRIAMGDPRVRYVSQPNSGANTARNRGIDEAQGPYLALLDADDHYLPTHLAESLEAIQAHPDHVIYGRIIVDRGNGHSFLKPPRGIAQGEPMSEYLMCAQGFIQTSTLVMKTETARDVRYTEGLANGQDVDFALRLHHAGHHFFMRDRATVVWRDVADPNRISASSSPDSRAAWLEKVRPLLTDKAYWGYKGWFLAKAYAQRGQLGTALRLYASAVRRSAYGPALSARVAAQILLHGRWYRRLSEMYLAMRKHRNQAA